MYDLPRCISFASSTIQVGDEGGSNARTSPHIMPAIDSGDMRSIGAAQATS
ncbi:hypothetical protein C7S13_8248 [Burkholderia cepacia]|nr:hypothetical protein [Burkholderia cepacia]